MPDIKSLETRLAKDKGYTGDSPAKDGFRGAFVCPRADAYGARDGVIPPSVAVTHGLIPKGMRHISPNDVARQANAARDAGLTAEEQYREYYARGAADANPKTDPKTATEAAQETVATPALPLAPPKELAVPKPRKRPKEPAVEVAGDPDDAGMFSRRIDAFDASDTLDGFYEELGRKAAGTAEAGRGAEKMAGLRPGSAGSPAGSGGEGAWGAPSPQQARAQGTLPDVLDRSDMAIHGRLTFPQPQAGQAQAQTKVPATPSQQEYMAMMLDTLSAERDRLLAREASLVNEVSALRRQLEESAERARQYAILERELRNQAPAERVRVILSVEEEKLKVGGRGWECNIVGAIHRGVLGNSMVLTVTDPSYASDLLAEISTGDMVILSGSGRTYCTYSGHCAKIYGDADSPDFITVVWLAIRHDGD